MDPTHTLHLTTIDMHKKIEDKIEKIVNKNFAFRNTAPLPSKSFKDYGVSQ